MARISLGNMLDLRYAGLAFLELCLCLLILVDVPGVDGSIETTCNQEILPTGIFMSTQGMRDENIADLQTCDIQCFSPNWNGPSGS